MRVHLPILFDVLNSKKINWTKVEKTFRKKFEYYKAKQLRLNSTYRIEASFYNIISDSIKKEIGAIRMLDYIQTLFTQLRDYLDEAEKKEIKKIIFGFLTNMDMKYLNFLGELSVLNLFKQTSPLKLIKTEEKLIKEKKRGSKIDFKFLNTETNKEELVEVVNIHLNEKNTLNNDTINNILTQKITEKLLETGLRESTSFYLIPVLWGQWPEIKAVNNYFNSCKPTFQNTSTPVCFMTFEDPDKNMVHRFGAIDKMFYTS
jgi:hypothetical protein